MRNRYATLLSCGVFTVLDIWSQTRVSGEESLKGHKHGIFYEIVSTLSQNAPTMGFTASKGGPHGRKRGTNKKKLPYSILAEPFSLNVHNEISHFSLWLCRDYFISVGLPCGNKLISFFFPDLWLIYHCPNAINSKFVEVSLVVA